MKKSIIAAGAASVALAAMPIVSTFAAGTIYGSPIKDTLTATVSEVCTLSRNAAAHPAGATAPQGAAWNNTVAGAGVGASDQTFTAVVVAGTAYADIAESTFDVTCNHASGGYEVTVGVTNFNDTTWLYDSSATGVGDASTWNLTSSAKETSGSAIAIDNNDAVWTGAQGSPVDTQSFTITYNLFPAISQATGSYSAVATYTLADL